MLPDHLHTRDGESRTSATGTDCSMCVLKGGNYSLYEYISVIYAAVRAVLLPMWSSRALGREATESFCEITHIHPARSVRSLQFHLDGSDHLKPGTDWTVMIIHNVETFTYVCLLIKTRTAS